MRAYAGVTAHAIIRTANGQLALKANLIGFLPVPGKHRGQDIANALVHITDRAKVTELVCISVVIYIPLLIVAH
jgi:hypothetical protein